MNKICKRVLCSALALCMCAGTALLGSGCSTDQQPTVNSTFNYETDMQYIYRSSGIYEPITKSDTGYYYVCGDNGGQGIVIYIDKSTKKATPLCSKPNCLHEDPDVCNAYFNFSSSPGLEMCAQSVVLQYYKDSLYTVCYDVSTEDDCKAYLMKIDKDGKNRERISNYFDFAVSKWMIHRGYFYYATDSTIFRVPADNPKSKPETVYKLDEFVKDSQNSYSCIWAYGDYVYFLSQVVVDNEWQGLKCYCVDVNNLKAISLESDGNVLSVDTYKNDKMISYYIDPKTEKCKYIESNPDGSSQTPLSGKAFEKYHTYFDGKYYYSDIYDDIGESDFKHNITVYDQNGNKADSFMLNKDANYSHFFANDEDYIITVQADEKGKYNLLMADKKQICSVNGKVLNFDTLCKAKWYKIKNNSNIIVEDRESDVNIPTERATKAE